MEDAPVKYARECQQALDALERELSQQDERLWQSAAFGEWADQFLVKLREAFAGVVPAEEERWIEVDVPVETPAYGKARRNRRRWRLALLYDLLRILIGRALPEEDYWRSVEAVTVEHRRKVKDQREPGGGPKTAKTTVPVKVERPPKRQLPKEDAKQDVRFLWVLGFQTSAVWLHQLRQAWNRLLGREVIPDSEYEPRLLEETTTKTVTLPEIPLEACTPVQRVYWTRRHEISADANDITNFILEWDGEIHRQSRASRDLVGDKDRLAKEVAALPVADEAPRQLKEIRKRMDKATSAMKKWRKEMQDLMQKIEKSKKLARQIRPELFP